jgi:hypothetical protein
MAVGFVRLDESLLEVCWIRLECFWKIEGIWRELVCAAGLVGCYVRSEFSRGFVRSDQSFLEGLPD